MRIQADVWVFFSNHRLGRLRRPVRFLPAHPEVDLAHALDRLVSFQYDRYRIIPA